jgi:peroxiredoxin
MASIGIIPICFSQTPHYEITGNIQGAEGLVFSLQKTVNGKVVTVNAGTVTNGVFKIVGGNVEYPEMVKLAVIDKDKNKNKNKFFYLDNSNFTITGNFDSFSELRITGSKTQDEYNNLTDSLAPFIKKNEELVKKYSDATRSGNVKKSAEIAKQGAALSNEMRTIQKNFIKTHPGSYVVPDLIRMQFNSLSLSEIALFINSLPPDVAKIQTVKELKEKLAILKNVEVGQKAPDFKMQDNHGDMVALSSKTGNGYLLIDFWAAWCNPCRKENPNVVKVYKEFKAKGFDIIGVSLDKDELSWYKAIENDRLTWTHVSDLQYWSNAAAKLYGVNSIPANFLLDKNGVIIARNLTGDSLYNKIKELVNPK